MVKVLRVTLVTLKEAVNSRYIENSPRDHFLVGYKLG